MKNFVITGLVLAFGLGNAYAACSESAGWKKMNAAGSGGSQALSTLGGKTVCVGSAPTWTNQEYHSGATSGPLIDYKRGPGHAVDPTSTIGSWSIAGDQIQYFYTGGATYIFDVYEKSGAYSFCNGTSSAAEATIRTGQVSC